MQTISEHMMPLGDTLLGCSVGLGWLSIPEALALMWRLLAGRSYVQMIQEGS